ncbi:porin family protein [Maribacter arenosus]|uniref:PorT family protein n=1 Tax=Maribacter arenosus TaxID=1854708 RepID=A0ABR7V9Z3_9FLAO|nr:porin family protein [Maribacter arenosus]MBD0850480.1 PorT family protein [Maribacter arenosus]
MKSIYLTCIYLVFLSTSIFAQETKVGIKGGLNLSEVNGDFTESHESRIGYHFGGYADIPLTNRFSFNPELLYSSIGYAFENRLILFDLPQSQNVFPKLVRRLNYLTIPLILRFEFNKKFGLDFGPQIGFLLNSVSKLKKSTNIDQSFDKMTSSGDFRFDSGAIIGMNYKINHKLGVQVRYIHGWTNLDTGGLSDNNKQFNRVFQLSFGYALFKISYDSALLN